MRDASSDLLHRPCVYGNQRAHHHSWRKRERGWEGRALSCGNSAGSYHFMTWKLESWLSLCCLWQQATTTEKPSEVILRWFAFPPTPPSLQHLAIWRSWGGLVQNLCDSRKSQLLLKMCLTQRCPQRTGLQSQAKGANNGRAASEENQLHHSQVLPCRNRAFQIPSSSSGGIPNTPFGSFYSAREHTHQYHLPA